MRLLNSILLTLLTLGTLSCSPPTGEAEGKDAISREDFIAAFVELRVAALQTEDQTVPPAVRERILSQLELEDQDLIDFVEVHGKDIQFMKRLWEEADSTLEDRRHPPEPRVPGGSA